MNFELDEINIEGLVDIAASWAESDKRYYLHHQSLGITKLVPNECPLVPEGGYLMRYPGGGFGFYFKLGQEEWMVRVFMAAVIHGHSFWERVCALKKSVRISTIPKRQPPTTNGNRAKQTEKMQISLDDLGL